ncbi:Phosphatidate cytidylyltransferase [Bifidobacterium actinocoloniiforme DSM 22766]|uniref:Phosphatidate cytidylyltransferase n=1 Tax=Bifidobacterium actinocoloniiforme DSM 22766 TaxID=1437605 RepID=A0A086Z0C6_9BIFI|nr:phosphatidate cytidylyltransferase [Bifidobacterium actinocoloniiforme]AKV55224.1 CDP-diglyceride synthetase [Bifidobacterium actinocoloniiforme DSM 22766]KFI39976.1 Phosphatidate cytidylyltransferase [Bifidobacterium actinocoloniiforme DSM 22766]
MNQSQEQEADQTLDSINRRTGRNMPQAIATGVLLVLVIVACVLIRPDAFMLLIVFFMTLGLWELRVDFATAGIDLPILALWICSAATMLAMFYSSDHVAAMIIGVLLTAVIVTIGSGLRGRASRRLERAVLGKREQADLPKRPGEDGFGRDAAAGLGPHERGSRYINASVALLTVVYITFLACLIVLPTTFGHPVAHAMMAVFLPAVSDIGGLFFGAWLGKHKLSPRISPKKSWEGLGGSMLLCAVASCAIFACTFPSRTWSQLWFPAICLGAMVGVTGTFGDLSASLIKRDLGIKDMGHLLKGHGGVLDRVDSILMSAPFIAAFLWITGL